jgi:hypothetical protein
MSAAENAAEPATSSNISSDTVAAPNAVVSDQVKQEATPRRPKKKQACRFFASKKGWNDWGACMMF